MTVSARHTPAVECFERAAYVTRYRTADERDWYVDHLNGQVLVENAWWNAEFMAGGQVGHVLVFAWAYWPDGKVSTTWTAPIVEIERNAEVPR